MPAAVTAHCSRRRSPMGTRRASGCCGSMVQAEIENDLNVQSNDCDRRALMLEYWAEVCTIESRYKGPVLLMPASRKKLLDEVRDRMRARHLSPRTELVYVSWIRRYVRYHGTRHPSELGETEIVAYLTHLASDRRVARS